MLMKLVTKLFGKKLLQNGIEKSGLSKTKLIAIVGGLVLINNYVLPAFGIQSVVVPSEIKELLAAAGLWTLADKIDQKA